MSATQHLTRRHLLAITAAATLGAAAGVRAATPTILVGRPATRQVTGTAFGSTWRITLADNARPDIFRPDIETLLSDIDRMMSPWRSDSEISVFNRSQVSEMPVSAEMALVGGAALDIAQRSNGWFDPTVGPVVARFGFGPITGIGSVQDAPHWQALRVSGESLSRTQPGTTIDLCGIAKGRALDLMSATLTGAGYADFLIDFGGELIARGRHPEGRSWQVAVDDPRPGIEGAYGVLALEDAAVATSGLKMQSYTVGDHAYSHIIDPHHGLPVESAVASVSVLARDAMTADGWATALTAAGVDGPALAALNGISAFFLFRNGNGLRSESVNGFDEVLL